MAFLRDEFNSLDDLFFHQLDDLYDSEKRLVEALPYMAEAASSPELKRAFEEHDLQTQGHVDRLEEIFERIGRTPEGETCQAMKGLISEGEEVIKTKGDSAVHDAALIAAAQRIEHYEMACYGAARTYAKLLGHEAATDFLQATLDEEGQTDERLTALAESKINLHARAA